MDSPDSPDSPDSLDSLDSLDSGERGEGRGERREERGGRREFTVKPFGFWKLKTIDGGVFLRKLPLIAVNNQTTDTTQKQL